GSSQVAQAPAQSPPAGRSASPPADGVHAREMPIVQDSSGSDYMADVIKSLGIEHVACNPGNSFRGLHESLINHIKMDWHTCTHEEASVAMANGYAKIEGKPLLVMAHGTVGLQHASMALYNAYCDRVPVYMMLGNTQNINFRRGSADWYHSVQDAAAMVRDYVKWDDTPVTLSHFAESAVRAYKIAMTPPHEPVVLVADGALQEEPITEKNLRIPKLAMSAPPQGDASAVNDAAKLLLGA